MTARLVVFTVPAKGQEGPEWLKCSLKMAPMVQAQRCKNGPKKGVKHGIQGRATNSNWPQILEEQCNGARLLRFKPK